MSWLVAFQTAPPIDPNVAKPGWIALVVTVALMLALVVLFLSMQKQMRKISVPKSVPDDDPPVGDGFAGEQTDPKGTRPDES